MSDLEQEYGTPLCAFEAIKASYKQTNKGVAVTFLVNTVDQHAALAAIPLGEIVNLFITKQDIGV